MKNRRLDHFGDIRGVTRRSRIFWKRSEADLIVHHDVNRPSGAVTVQLRQVERLGHDPLCDERGITMHQQWQNLFPMLGVSANALPRARFPFDHRIDSFQVTRV